MFSRAQPRKFSPSKFPAIRYVKGERLHYINKTACRKAIRQAFVLYDVTDVD